MPGVKDTNLEGSATDVDQATATPEGIEPWPSDGTREEKLAALVRVRERRASPEQVAVLRQALAANEDSSMTVPIMCALEWLAGHETSTASGKHYTYGGITSEYEVARSCAATVHVRNALHIGFAQFRPTDSKDGMIRQEEAERLKGHLHASRDPKEMGVLVAVLRDRAGYDEAQLLDALNSMLGDPTRSITYDELCVWVDAVSRVASEQSWRKEQVLLEASTRLTHHWRQLSDRGALIRALAFLSHDGFRLDLWSVFAGHAEHSDAGVRSAAIPGLARLGEDGRNKLIAMLGADSDQDVLSRVWTSLEESGRTIPDLIGAISRHTDSTISARVVLRQLIRRRGGTAWDLMQTLWPGLTPSFRDAIRRVWRQDIYDTERSFHHHFWWEFMHDLRHWIGEGFSGIAAIRWLTRPFDDVIGAVDFEQVSGLRREVPVELQSVDLLRFSYLVDASDRRGRSLADILHRSDFSVEQLIADEEHYDQTRDQLARVRHQLDQYAAHVGSDVLAELRRGDVGDERSAFGRLRDRLGDLGDGQILELVREVERLSREVRFVPGDEQSFFRLFSATKSLSHVIREVGCSFDGLQGPDGILGEYQPVDRSVTLFGPMIDLAADAVARQLGRPEGEISPLVRTVVEVHELAHAHLHLGRDARGGIWDSPGDGSVAHHEAVAQAYTRRLIAGMDLHGLKDVLFVMEGWLSQEYRYADLLDHMDAEDLRAWVVGARKTRGLQTLEAVAETVARALPGYLTMVASQLPAPAFQHVTRDLQRIVSRPPADASPETLVDLLTVVGALPNAVPVLGPFVPGGWPTSDRLSWLLFEARIAGPPAGERPLRFIKRQAHIRAVSATPPVAVVGPLPSLRRCASILESPSTSNGRSMTDELPTEPSTSPVAPSIGANLPRRKKA